MNESQFLQLSDDIFNGIQQVIDESGLDADCLINGNVLEIELEDGGKIIINRHTANQEIWIAAKSGGYHFAKQGDHWIATRDGAEFFATLSQVVEEASGQSIHFNE